MDNDFSPTDALVIWNRLWEKLVLTTSDLEKLRNERGFSDETIQSLGFRTSQAQNRGILDSLGAEFPPDQLVRLGIWRQGDEGYFANGIFCGWGATGEFVKNSDGSFKLDGKRRKIRERKQGVNPILIPYLDAGGKPETIRPHKDNVSRPQDVDDLDEDYTGLHVYCAHLLRTVATSKLFTDNHRNFCVLTEGEYKAAALYQCGIPAIAMPGIQSARNPAFRRRLIALLRSCGITEVVICFDNEVKDDPAFPNYKADEWDRVDTIVYARYTASTLYREGIKSTRISNLPDEWRENGKADWDGALARFVREAKGNIERGTVLARAAFLKVLRGAKYESDCRDLFASSVHRIIEAKLAALYHTDLCPIGGDDEKRLGWRIKRLKDIPSAVDYTQQLGQAFIDTFGVHYSRKPLRRGGWKEEELMLINTGRETAKAAQDWSRFHYYKELLAGIPGTLSNFALRCRFKLISSDGRMEYLVTVRNIHNERTEQHVRVDGATLASLKLFRQWCLENVSSTWHGGERDLQALTADMQAHSAFREIHEIDTYGYSDKCNLWKFADRAFTPQGKELLPDKDLVFWYNGLGYQTDFDKSRIGEGYSQGAPTLGDLDLSAAISSFNLFAQHLLAALGDLSGWLALGTVLSYAVHPEVFRTYMGVPGLWFTGRRGGGKSTIAEWLIQIWGLAPKLNISLGPDTTPTSIGRELSKYGSLPLPLDEFDATVTDQRVQEMLKNAFTRLSGLKATYDSSKNTRSVKPGTTPFVLGENSSRNSATRSRYVNISILDEKAIGDKTARLADMNASAHLFPNLGHFLMKNRPQFAEGVMDILAKWVGDPVIAKFVPRVRDRFISGLPFASFVTLAKMLYPLAKDADQEETLYIIVAKEDEFRTFAMEHGSESQKEVTDTSYANIFWQDLLNLVQVGGSFLNFRRLFLIKHGSIDKERRVTALDSDPFDGSIPIMFVAYESAFYLYTQEIRKTGRDARLSIKDLVRELRQEKYWIRPKKDESHKMSIENVGRPVCWAFDLVEHPFGDEFRDALRPPQHNSHARTQHNPDLDL